MSEPATPAAPLTGHVWRWAPSTARSVLSVVGVRAVSTVPVQRFAVLQGSVLRYYHQEEAYENEEEAHRVWELSPYCKVGEVLTYNYGRKESWSPLSTNKIHSMCYCFTVSWPTKQVDGHSALQIGFDTEDDAKAWHARVSDIVSGLISDAGLNSSVLKKINREYTPRGADAKASAEDENDEEVGTWYAVKHINGGEY